MARQPQTLMVDTGYWYGLYDPRDQHSREARVKSGYLNKLHVIVPWPTVYETVGSRFVKNHAGMTAFEAFLKSPNITFIDDTPYRETALAKTFESSRLKGRAISFCDMLIRLMIDDRNVQINALLTFNARDFSDVCRTRQVHIL